MAKVNFTDRWLKTASVMVGQKQTDYWDEVVEGLCLRVSYGGRKAWVLGYRTNGRWRRFTFGKYPDKPLADARAKARDFLVRVARGEDPGQQKIVDRKAETFEDLCLEYLEHHAMPNKKSWREDERVLNKEVISIWRTRKAVDISRREVTALLDDTVKRGAPIQANRLLALLRKVFNFGVEREIVETNPCWSVKRPINEKSRQGQRVLNYFEIRKVWNSIEKQSPLMSTIFKLRLLTAQRGSEIRSMKWADLELETAWWTIPGSVTKNKLQHRVPLNQPALDLLHAIRRLNLQSEYVFPSPKNPSTFIDSIHKAIDRIKIDCEVNFVERDFRRTVASHMTGDLKVPRLVVSKILNHVESGITKVYDRHGYDQEKKQSLDAWGALLSKIILHPNSQLNDVSSVADMKMG